MIRTLDPECVNDVTLCNSCVTFIMLKIRTLDHSKIVKKMQKEKDKSDTQEPRSEKKGENASKGYPLYPEDEDIFNKYQEEKDIDPSVISKTDESKGEEEIIVISENEVANEGSGESMDVPGEELDDDQENVGSEDEENNYYSIGGDDHTDLDEDQGE